VTEGGVGADTVRNSSHRIEQPQVGSISWPPNVRDNGTVVTSIMIGVHRFVNTVQADMRTSSITVE
jgi:hypothetical protein